MAPLWTVMVSVVATLSMMMLVTVRAVTIEIPPVYFHENNFMHISRSQLWHWAERYCNTTANPTSEEFFFNFVPLYAANQSCTQDERFRLSVYFGASYLSGYLNGVYLRDALQNATNQTNSSCPDIRQALTSILLQMGVPDEFNFVLGLEDLNEPTESDMDRLMFPVIVQLGEKLFLNIGLYGSNETILLQSQLSYPSYSLLYGFRLGVYDQLRDDKPPGGKNDTLKFHSSPFNASVDFFNFTQLTRFQAIIPLFQHPNTTLWRSINRTLETTARLGFELGENFWDSMVDASASSSGSNLGDGGNGNLRSNRYLQRSSVAARLYGRDIGNRYDYPYGGYPDDSDSGAGSSSTSSSGSGSGEEHCELDASIYDILYDSQVVGILVNDLMLLAAVDSFGNEDVSSGRCSLFEGANLMTWSLSYVMGLYSDLPYGTMPTLNCTGTPLSE